MRIDPAALVASLSSLADTAPQWDLAGTLQQVVDAARVLFRVKGVGIMLADEHGQLRWVTRLRPADPACRGQPELLGRGPCAVAFSQRAPAVMRDARHEPEWGEIALLFSDVEVQAAASVPIELAGGPIGTLDVYAVEPRDWDPSEISALQAYAGVVASLLAAAAQAQVKGRLTAQLQVALETRVLIEQAKGALMARQDIDEATAFEWLRLSARSSSRTVTVVAQEILAGRWPPMPRLAEAVGRLARARQAEQRAHARAIALQEQAADQHAQLGRTRSPRPNETAPTTPGSGWSRRWLKTNKPGSASWGATAAELLAKPDPGVVPASVSTGRDADADPVDGAGHPRAGDWRCAGARPGDAACREGQTVLSQEFPPDLS